MSPIETTRGLGMHTLTMARRSLKTFQEERTGFQGIERIFWDSEHDYPLDPFNGILSGSEDDTVGYRAPGYSRDPYPAGPGRRVTVGPGGLLILHDNDAVEQITEAAKNSDAEFIDAFWRTLGIDIEEELAVRAESQTLSDEGKARSLTAQFGTEAIGTYCPWHAYGESARTPWGIYILLDRFFDTVCDLYTSGEFFPAPKPLLVSVIRFLWWTTYRHELFHFHVEVFATRLESALRTPFYRPYVELVRARVVNTPECWEEALAQAVVLESRMVKQNAGINSKYMKEYVVPYFRTFPDGYRHFECLSVGGPEAAHRLLSAQIARAKIDLPKHECNTGLSLAKNEYSSDHRSVPGYLMFRQTSWMSRFQLQTPRLRDVTRYIKRIGGEIDENAPGDHKRVRLRGQTTQLNKAGQSNVADLASMKSLARLMGITVFDLVKAIG
jgi:hypothetical protein